ncbi:MoaD/ThiS family protein [Lewinella sp. 4G2]|uniref:MoaD/ThiS family protein n=1 Tax=Lewinella sp. 4G2 TaxID=1803372 RepID=UPI0007B46E0F|nr:MoaD/ThiS family protein [Lewinella sp. 4G2]OAV44966.1 hypothetical protein A3850_010885 [Lewinella sp. 4G2]
MTINVHTFAAAKELLGSPISVIVHKGATVAELRAAILEQYVELGELKDFAIARNEAYARPEDPITASDNLVIIPPVSGG